MAKAWDARARKTTPLSMPEPRELRQAMRGFSVQEIAAAQYLSPDIVQSVGMGRPIAASVSDPSATPQMNAAMKRRMEEDIYGSWAEQELGEWYEYWSETQSGYSYNNLAGSGLYQNPDTGKWERGVAVGPGSTNSSGSRYDRRPADISVVPTSTINVNRPRTVAAGYDTQRQVLTVVFRDGTFYNYYEVPVGVWQDFKRRTSKGRFILEVLDAYPRGTANMSGTSTMNREQLYRISRGHQIASGPSTVSDKGRRSSQGVSTKMQQVLSTPAKAGRAPASKGGKNPSRNGMKRIS